jgi:hypothetical protein
MKIHTNLNNNYSFPKESYNSPKGKNSQTNNTFPNSSGKENSPYTTHDTNSQTKQLPHSDKKNPTKTPQYEGLTSAEENDDNKPSNDKLHLVFFENNNQLNRNEINYTPIKKVKLPDENTTNEKQNTDLNTTNKKPADNTQHQQELSDEDLKAAARKLMEALLKDHNPTHDILFNKKSWQLYSASLKQADVGFDKKRSGTFNHKVSKDVLMNIVKALQGPQLNYILDVFGIKDKFKNKPDEFYKSTLTKLLWNFPCNITISPGRQLFDPENAFDPNKTKNDDNHSVYTETTHKLDKLLNSWEKNKKLPESKESKKSKELRETNESEVAKNFIIGLLKIQLKQKGSLTDQINEKWASEQAYFQKVTEDTTINDILEDTHVKEQIKNVDLNSQLKKEIKYLINHVNFNKERGLLETIGKENHETKQWILNYMIENLLAELTTVKMKIKAETNEKDKKNLENNLKKLENNLIEIINILENNNEEELNKVITIKKLLFNLPNQIPELNIDNNEKFESINALLDNAVNMNVSIEKIKKLKKSIGIESSKANKLIDLICNNIINQDNLNRIFTKKIKDEISKNHMEKLEEHIKKLKSQSNNLQPAPSEQYLKINPGQLDKLINNAMAKT